MNSSYGKHFVKKLNLINWNNEYKMWWKCFQTVYKLLQILITLTVTTASEEKSFSTLKRLKTYLRNMTSENRLNGLGLLNIHRDIKISTDDL